MQCIGGKESEECRNYQKKVMKEESKNVKYENIFFPPKNDVREEGVNGVTLFS